MGSAPPGDSPPAHLEHLARRLTTEVAPPSREREAVVIMLLRGEADHLEVLLMRRVEHPDDPWSGQISLPGGHVDSTDTTLEESALRETREEVNLDLGQSGRWLGCLPAIQATRLGRALQLTITPFVFGSVDDTIPTPGPEAQEVFWFPLTRAGAGDLDETHRVEFDGGLRDMPGWRFDGHMVWGLTRRMLCDLLERLSVPS